MITAQCNFLSYKNYRPLHFANPIPQISELCSHTIRTFHDVSHAKIKIDLIEVDLKSLRKLWGKSLPPCSKTLGALYRSPPSNNFFQRRASFNRCDFNGKSILHYRSRAIELRNVYASGSSSWTHTGQRRYFFLGRRIKRLTEEADKFTTDPEKQAALLSELNKTDPLAVIKRFESSIYVNNEQTTKEYIKALVQLGLFDRVKLGDMVALNRYAAEATLNQQSQPLSDSQSAGSGGVSSEMAANAAGATLGAPNAGGAGLSAAGSGPAPSLANILFSDTKPVPVKVVRGFWSKVLPLFLPIWWVVIIYVFIKFTTGDREPISLFDVPSHHDRAMVVETRFDAVKGCDEAKAELKEVVEYLKEPSKFSEIGAQLPKGILLVGEPGTGKTLLARAIAGEAGVPFFYCSGSSFDEIFVGVGSKRVRSLFDDAKKNAPCIVFIDEIDAVGGKRSKWHTGSQDGTLQQLLTELDGFEKNEGIIVIAATNMPESLDTALVRPGRFDKQIVVPVPDVKGRKEILDLYLAKIKVAPDVDSEMLARATPGLTGADLSQLVNLAAIKAVVQGKKVVDRSIIEETRDDIWMGRMRKSALVDEKTRRMTAYHEGGHALVSIFTEGSDPIHKATIIQRGHALGMVTHLPEGDQLSMSRKQMMAKLAVCMAGRAAEELIFGTQDVTSGASSDFQQATSLAYNMVTKWGMSERVGFIYMQPKDRKMSPDTMLLVDQEVKDLLEKQYTHAKNLLTKYRRELDMVAKALMEHETLTGEDLKKLIGAPLKVPEATNIAIAK